VRARVVALAIAGLARELALVADANVGASREPARAPLPRPPAPPPEQSSATTEPVAPTTERVVAQTIELDLLAQAGNFATSQDFVWGGGARVQYLALFPWRVAFDVQAGTFARDTALGSARLLLGSAGARAGYALGGPALALVAGAGGRLGLARASASTRDSTVQAASVLGVWGAPFGFFNLEAVMLGRYSFGLDAELGGVVLPVRGRVEGGGDIEVRGLWAALSAVFGIRF
jgi:hypothetical protein